MWLSMWFLWTHTLCDCDFPTWSGPQNKNNYVYIYIYRHIKRLLPSWSYMLRVFFVLWVQGARIKSSQHILAWASRREWPCRTSSRRRASRQGTNCHKLQPKWSGLGHEERTCRAVPTGTAARQTLDSGPVPNLVHAHLDIVASLDRIFLNLVGSVT